MIPGGSGLGRGLFEGPSGPVSGCASVGARKATIRVALLAQFGRQLFGRGLFGVPLFRGQCFHVPVFRQFLVRLLLVQVAVLLTAIGSTINASAESQGGPALPASEHGLPATQQAMPQCATLRSLAPTIRTRLGQGKTLVDLEDRPNRRTKRALVLREIKASLGVVAAVLNDHERLPDLVSTVRAAQVIDRDERTVRVRQVLDLPFPLRNRRYTIEIETALSDDCFESSWTYVEGSGNIRGSAGRWEVLSQDRGNVLVAYVIHADPGGFVPGWAANWASKRALPEVVESIGDAAEDQAMSAPP